MTWFSMALNLISAPPNVIALLKSTMIDWKTALISGHINLIEENLKFPANLVKLTEEILNGKLHFLCSDILRSLFITFDFHYINDPFNTSLQTDETRIFV